MSASKLWLKQVDETYRTTDSVIGPWCFEGNETANPNWDKDTYLNPFKDVNKLVATSKYAIYLAEYLIRDMANDLNEQHGLNHSYYFWRHILSGWLVFVIHISYIRYKHVKIYAKTHQDKAFHVETAPSSTSWNFKKPHDIVKNAPHPDFDFWLSSFIVHHLKINNWTVNEQTEFTPDIVRSEENESIVIPSKTIADKLKYPIRAVLYKYLQQSRLGPVYGMGWKERILLSLYLSLKQKVKNPVRAIYQKHIVSPSDYDHKTFFEDEYITLLQKLIPIVMPESFQDGFVDIYKNVSKKSYKAGRIRVRTPDVFRENDKVENALAAENGELVVQTQHGSWYGIVACGTVSHISEYGLYGFLTWGWNKHDDIHANFIPAPAPMLVSANNAKRITASPNNGRLLFVNNKTYTRSSRLEGQPQAAQTVRDRHDKIIFLKTLSQNIHPNIAYRPHTHHSMGIDDTAAVRKTFPDLNVMDQGSINDFMLNSKMFVANHYSTGFHSAMVANVPCVCFWPDDIIPITNKASKYHQALIDNKIIFDNPEDAANHINEIWDDIDAWWMNESVQKARLEWCKKYAYTETHYLKTWLQMLSRLGKTL